MNDTLEYMTKGTVHRKFHHNKLTFGLLYAFSENFILPLSHDEVVHGKGSLLDKMPGDRWQKFANLRAYLAFLYTQPGKKLLFMGGEFGQAREWDHDRSLDWHLLQDAKHAGVQRLVRDLNFLYRGLPALHVRDCEPEGFSWIDCNDADSSIISYLRHAANIDDFAVIVCNFTQVVRHGYRIGVPRTGHYREVMNTDSSYYGGSNVGNSGAVATEDISMHGHRYSISLTLPPLGVVVLRPEGPKP
jgi:1,4-alpha-glucan branching enzyme